MVTFLSHFYIIVVWGYTFLSILLASLIPFFGASQSVLTISNYVNSLNFFNVLQIYCRLKKELSITVHRNRDSSLTGQFTNTHFEDSSPTELKTVHRQN